jgi:hypothetical protein
MSLHLERQREGLTVPLVVPQWDLVQLVFAPSIQLL